MNRVGPVLESGEAAEAVLAAIRADNHDVEVLDRGAYVRIGVPGRCVLRRATVETALGRAFSMPADLERIMPAFAGSFLWTDELASWQAEEP